MCCLHESPAMSRQLFICLIKHLAIVVCLSLNVQCSKKVSVLEFEKRKKKQYALEWADSTVVVMLVITSIVVIRFRTGPTKLFIPPRSVNWQRTCLEEVIRYIPIRNATAQLSQDSREDCLTRIQRH